jgi:hypothetical protein
MCQPGGRHQVVYEILWLSTAVAFVMPTVWRLDSGSCIHCVTCTAAPHVLGLKVVANSWDAWTGFDAQLARELNSQ